jgi:hypothetical protein
VQIRFIKFKLFQDVAIEASVIVIFADDTAIMILDASNSFDTAQEEYA